MNWNLFERAAPPTQRILALNIDYPNFSQFMSGFQEALMLASKYPDLVEVVLGDFLRDQEQTAPEMLEGLWRTIDIYANGA